MKKRHPVIDGCKVCTKCGERKPVSEFYQIKNGRLTCYCKDCYKNIHREYYLANKEKILQRQKEDYQKKGKPRKPYNKGLYEKHKESILRRSMEQYYNTDYLEKKYLKRFKESRKKVQEKLEALLRKVQEKGFKSAAEQKKQDSYEASLARWDSKITQVEDLMTIYKAIKKQPEEEKQEQQSITVNNMEEQKPASVPMTKERLINLLSEVPNNARIIYVGDTENRSNLVAAWRSDPYSVCIRNLNATMPYIITEGTLYDLVSATLPFPECQKKGDSL